MNDKICSICGKSGVRFARDGRRPNGYSGTCLECRELGDTATRFGITREELWYLFASQNSLCAICLMPEHGKRLAVDHDHSCCTGCRNCIRGLLCGRCNRMLGLAEAQPSIAAPFSDYLNQRPLRRNEAP